MKYPIIFLIVCFFLSSCGNDSQTHEEGKEVKVKQKSKINDIKPPKPYSKVEYVKLVEDDKTLRLKSKIEKHLKLTIGPKYLKVFDDFENSLIDKNLMPSKDGKGFLAFIQNCKESGSMDYISPANINRSSKNGRINFGGFSLTLQKYHEQMGNLQDNSPLWFYYKLALEIKSAGTIGPSSFYDPILAKLDEETLNDHFYRSFTILFILGGVL